MRNVGCLLCKLVGLTRVKEPGLPMELLVLNSWWRHQLDTFSVLLAIYEGNSQVISEFPSQRLGTQSFQGFFLSATEQTAEQTMVLPVFETPSRSLWRHCDCSLICQRHPLFTASDKLSCLPETTAALQNYLIFCVCGLCLDSILCLLIAVSPV